MMILGLVKWMQPVHGYDVRRELLSWNADKWASVQPGSIYYALRKLTEEGLLREVTTEQVGARPARTTYEVTPKGVDEFESLLRDLWWGNHQAVDPFLAAFAFLPALPRAEAAAALRSRAQVLRVNNETCRAALESDWIRQSKPRNVAWMYELWIARGEAEAAWCDRIADLIESGVPYLPERLASAQEWSGFGVEELHRAMGGDADRGGDQAGGRAVDRDHNT
jgi:DNA-binding PadR family transcriptional regulator